MSSASALSKAFATDKTLERDGVDVELVQNADGSWVTFRLARAGANNPAYQRVADFVMKPYRRQQQLGVLPPEKLNALTREIFAQAGVIGWKNVPKGDVTGDDADSTDKDGKAVYAEYSKDACMSLFERFSDLYNMLVEMSVQHTTFSAANTEDDAKNSKKS